MIIVIAFTLSATTATILFAEEDEATEAFDKSIWIANDSHENRDEMMIYAGIGSGIHIPTLLGSPMYKVGWVFNKHRLIFLEYGKNVSGLVDGGVRLDGSYENAGIFWREFFDFNSFNVLFGVSRRVLDMSIKVRIDNKNSDLTNETNSADNFIKATADVFTLGIGNQWTWASGFFISVDWVAYNYAFGSESDAYVTAGDLDSTETSGATKQLEDLGHDINKGISASPGFLLTTIGWGF